MKKIYLADDEENIRQLIKSFLENENYSVEIFPDGESLLDRFHQEIPDLVILDIMMPGIDGLNLCAILRQESTVPIIIVSAKDSPMDRVKGITLGSDDYLVKPFLPLELTARVKALFRRSELSKSEFSAGDLLHFGDLTMDRRLHLLLLKNLPLSITPTEYSFLEYMMERGDMAVRKTELLTEVWKFPVYDTTDTRTVDDAVKRLRKKLRESGSIVFIETVWGFGFRLSLCKNEVSS